MTSVSLNTPKDHALYYAKELGFSVFVLPNPDNGTEKELKTRKIPAVSSWREYMETPPSEDQINQWFATNPNYNLAAAMANVSKVIAIDVDGPTAAKKIEEKIPEMSTNLRVALQNTMVDKTGSGGQHIIFRMEDPIIEKITPRAIWKNGEEHSEIKIQGNGSYIVMPPSRHPNGNYYEWNGKTPDLLTKEELEEFIRLVAANPKNADIPLRNNKPTTGEAAAATEEITIISNTTAPEETLQELYDLIKPYYTTGNRNDIIFHLSGFMRKDGGFSLADCKKLVTKLCESSGYTDEDLDKSLNVVENTFNKNRLEDLKGRSGLHEILVSNHDADSTDTDEFKARTEAYGKIFEIVTGNNKSKEENLIDGCIMMEPVDPDSRFYTTVFSKDAYFDRGTNSTRPVRMIRQLQIRHDEEHRKDVIEPKQVILNAAPIPPIEIIHDPLFEQLKYRIVFEYVGTGNTVKQEIVGPYTKEELKTYLSGETPWVFKERLLPDAINHMIAGFTRKKDMAIFRTETQTEGLIWSHSQNRLVLSQRTLYKPTPEECRKCISVINELQEKFYVPTEKTPLERKRFAHFIKIGIVSIIDFARRQNGAVGDDNWIPRQDLSGWSKSGKSYGYAGLALRMYRLPLHGSSKYVIGSGSVETEARFIEQTKGTTMPVIFDDADYLTNWETDQKAKRILPLIKNATNMTNPRDILSSDSKRKSIPCCAYSMFTHNSGLITEDGFIRRSTGHEFTLADEKDPRRMVEYEQFFKQNGRSFGYLGDFVIWYYLEHPEVLFNDWLTIAKTILQAFYEYAEVPKEEVPIWLLEEIVESATSQEALAENMASGIVTTLHDLTLNQAWSRNRRDIISYIIKEIRKDTEWASDKIDDTALNSTIEEKLEAMVKLNLLPYFRWHEEKEICIGAGFVEELKKRGHTRISLKQIPSFCNELRYNDHVRFGDRTNKKNKMLTIKLKDFSQLINLVGNEEKQTTLNGPYIFYSSTSI